MILNEILDNLIVSYLNYKDEFHSNWNIKICITNQLQLRVYKYTINITTSVHEVNLCMTEIKIKINNL